MVLCMSVLVLCHAGTLEAPEGATGAELSPMQPPMPADIRDDEELLVTLAAEQMPEAGSQAAASTSTPQHLASAAEEHSSAEIPTMAFPAFEGAGDALMPVSTPEHRPCPHSEGTSVQAPVPAEAASEAEGPVPAALKTPVPGPSPQLPGQPDLITPPPQILDDMVTPDVDASYHMQQNTPDEAPEDSTQQEVHCLLHKT